MVRKRQVEEPPTLRPHPVEKAKQLAAGLGDHDFKPTEGWLGRWKQRNNIVFRRCHGEKKDADAQSGEDWIRDALPTILQEYDSENVYNCDETGLLYRALPTGTLTQKTEKVSGEKKAMDRISVMLCCNMAGSNKLTPLVIGHSRKPRCFRGQRVPLPWESNNKAWMTAAIFRDWIRKIDGEMGMQQKKIVLLLNNRSAHPHDIPLDNIRLVFLPANTTSLIQPLDRGIIRNFKSLYRSQLLKRVLNAIDNIDNAQKFAKTMTVLDALFMVREAWMGVNEDIIRNCFRKALITAPGQQNSPEPIVQAPEGMVQEEFEAFVDIDVGEECTGDPTDNELCQEVLQARDATSTHDESPADDEEDDLSPPPSSANVINALDVLRRWMQFHDYKDYSKFVAMEGDIHSFCLHKKKQNAPIDFLGQPPK